MTEPQQDSEFVQTLEALTQESVWLTILGLAGEGLVELPGWVREKTVEALEDKTRMGPPKIAPEDTMRVVRRLQDKIEVMGGAYEVFCSLIRSGGHIRQDGSLRTYREIATIFGDFRSSSTYRRWMVRTFPEVAKAMREAHV